MKGTALLLAVATACGAGCRHVPLSALFVRGGSVGWVEAGPYASDERVTGLLAGWGERVGRAQDRLALLTGLDLTDVEGEARLAPLGDERRPWTLKVVLRQGRRQPVLTVNLERLATGAEDADRVLARGLTLGALEVALLRAGAVLPPWAQELAATAAAGDLAEQVEALVRDDVYAGREPGARVDPADPAHARSTGVAALLLLLERGGPERVRAFLTGLADGEPAAALLQRLAREHGNPWPAARRALELQLTGVDARPWRLLLDAEAAWREAGRAGLLAMLPPELPGDVREELLVLGARAAFAEGDVGAARAALAALGPQAAGRLRDPLAATALRVKAEAAPGGDQTVALALVEALERDYPTTDVVARLREEARLPEAPERALAALERRAEGERLATLALEDVRRLLDLLTKAQRHGAAQRLLDRLGERASAPELAPLAQAIASQQEEPSAEALESAEQALEAWRRAPTSPEAEALVVAHGTASARRLVVALAEGRVPERHAALRLLGRAAGPSAVALLAPGWNADPRRVAPELEALAEGARVPELEVWTRGHAEAALSAIDAGALFDGLRLDLPEAYVRGTPDLPTRLRATDYAVRREAFDETQRDGQAHGAPRLVARFLADPSPLLRRDAARVAGAGGFEALARAALEDPIASVRRAAADALGHGSEPASLSALLRVLAEDESPWVRAAAAHAAELAAPARPVVMEALVAALADPHPLVVEAARLALEEVPPRAFATVALAALDREARRAEPRPQVWRALTSLLEPLVGLEPSLDALPRVEDRVGAVARLRTQVDAALAAATRR